MPKDETTEQISSLLAEQAEDTRRVIGEVLKIEKTKLHQVRVIGAKDEIVAAIKDIVK
jgi:hypothetical protein